jgi:hypothetical protein
MRLRAVQLACMVLLLSSLSAAKGTTLRSGEFGLGGHYISTLLARDHAAAADDANLRARFDDHANAEIAAAAATESSIVWTMRPPAAHSANMHAVTGSGL